MIIRFAVLRCLIGGPTCAAEIERALAAMRLLYPLEHVNVNPVLNDLEYEGLVRSEIRVSHDRPDREYAITASGRDAFEAWEMAPPESASAVVRDPVHLRLALATDDLRSLDWLSWVIPEIEDETERARRLYERNRCNLTPIARLAVEELITQLERRRAFLLRALELARAPEARRTPARAAVRPHPTSATGC